MAFPKSAVQTLVVVIQALTLLQLAESLNFNYPKFDPNNQDIHLENDSYIAKGVIQLTENQAKASQKDSVGRASYAYPIPLWDATTKEVTNFTTNFTFIMNGQLPYPGDGISFFLAPFNSSAAAPQHSEGGCLGLISDPTPGSCNNTRNVTVVAVEFDTAINNYDPRAASTNHVGIDVNSVVSSTYVNWTSTPLNNGSIGNAYIKYTSSTNNLSVFLTFADPPIYNEGDSSLWYTIDLSSVLPEQVRIGFAASTGTDFEVHQVLSWDFSSTLTEDSSVTNTHRNSTLTENSDRKGKSSSKAGLIGGIAVGMGVLIVVGLACIWLKRRQKQLNGNSQGVSIDKEADFEMGTMPGRFTFDELRLATNNFSEEGRLGEGGFGVVYKGALQDPYREIAVKKVSKRSQQGKKEYLSEVTIINRLRHRNLVQLLGWCHDKEDFLLVYEYMPNGSLDSHLYMSMKPALQWEVRFKIAHGLASALLYLHEEWEQCVLHRDVKSSNVMLDSNFNAKLGDFGLARLVDHELGSQTTVLAGTLGYMAPECTITGKASKESDVYSFGVVALEIACGRRPVMPLEEPSKVRLIEWVWNLYGQDSLLQAVDASLDENFNMEQIVCLMIVGLWCCHPDSTSRPTARQLINILHFQAPLPNLPLEFPKPIYSSYPIYSTYLTSTTSSEITDVSGTKTTLSSHSGHSHTSPLLPHSEISFS